MHTGTSECFKQVADKHDDDFKKLHVNTSKDILARYWTKLVKMASRYSCMSQPEVLEDALKIQRFSLGIRLSLTSLSLFTFVQQQQNHEWWIFYTLQFFALFDCIIPDIGSMSRLIWPYFYIIQSINQVSKVWMFLRSLTLHGYKKYISNDMLLKLKPKTQLSGLLQYSFSTNTWYVASIWFMNQHVILFIP